MPFDQADVELVEIDWLKAHEMVVEKKVDELHRMTLRWQGYTKPLLVDSRTGTILDGHHRFTVGQRMELRRIPVILIDYLTDSGIGVETWPSAELECISKEEVISMALSGELYPPKTSRHVIEGHLPPIMVPLESLV